MNKTKSEQLLGGAEWIGMENARVHVFDERNRVGDHLVPAGMGPGRLPLDASIVQALVTPNMVDVVEASDLGEEAPERFVVALAERDGARPVVSPLDHRARLEEIGPNLVDIGPLALVDDGPKAERKQELVVAGAEQRQPFFRERLQGLVAVHDGPGLVDAVITIIVSPKMNALVLVSYRYTPRPAQFHMQRGVTFHFLHVVFIVFQVLVSSSRSDIMGLKLIDDFFVG